MDKNEQITVNIKNSFSDKLLIILGSSLSGIIVALSSYFLTIENNKNTFEKKELEIIFPLKYASINSLSNTLSKLHNFSFGENIVYSLNHEKDSSLKNNLLFEELKNSFIENIIKIETLLKYSDTSKNIMFFKSQSSKFITLYSNILELRSTGKIDSLHVIRSRLIIIEHLYLEYINSILLKNEKYSDSTLAHYLDQIDHLIYELETIN
ncbi:MAG: hypothetical protein HWD90_07900 [Campylobacteraceae bacterium]|nr:hypothetical protein [Campylobacteraceae bacterium]